MISFEQIGNGTKQDKNKKLAVFTFGRFNPPTKGHAKLFEKTHKIAVERGGTPYVFPSPTHGKRRDKQNPLPHDLKVEYLTKLMPWCNVVNNTNVNSAWAAVDFLAEQGYTEIILVVGSDRVEDFDRRWRPYAEALIERATVVNAGHRDPDGEGVAAMSATKAQEAAAELNIGKFRTATGWSGELANSLMRDVAKYIKDQ